MNNCPAISDSFGLGLLSKRQLGPARVLLMALAQSMNSGVVAVLDVAAAAAPFFCVFASPIDYPRAARNIFGRPFFVV